MKPLAAALVALALAGVILIVPLGCEAIGPAFGEARSAAADARDAAERAEAYAQATGDPDALALAQDAKAQAQAVDAQLAELETKALAWADAAESGELGAAEGSEMGGLIGGLAGPQWGVAGSLVGGLIGGWYYRNRARQIVRAIDAGKAVNPRLDEAFGDEPTRKAISRNMSVGTWKFVEAQRE